MIPNTLFQGVMVEVQIQQSTIPSLSLIDLICNVIGTPLEAKTKVVESRGKPG